MVYLPSEDSYLLEKEVKEYLESIEDKDIKILDMGSGSGIQSKACIKKGFENVLAVDIDRETLNHLKKQKLKTRKSNLFSNLKDHEKFDLIIFNPPYLPEDKYDKGIDTTAGKKGYEIILRFLKQAQSHLKKEGIILLLVSSLSNEGVIKKKSKELGYKLKKLNEKGVGFFENLYIYELKL